MKILMIILALLLNSSPRGHVDKEQCAYFFDERHEPQEIKLSGKVRVVDIGETLKLEL